MFLRRMMMAQAATASDPYWSNVVALLHFDGTDGSTTFTDEKGHAFTALGNAQIDTSEKKFGTGSGLFDGSGDYLSAASSADFGFGSGDWTVESFVRPSVTPVGNVCLFDNRSSGVQGIGIYVSANMSGNKFSIATNSAIVAYGGTFTQNQWAHMAVTRSGNTVRGFIAGVLMFTYTDTRTYASSAPLKFGADNVGGAQFNGRTDEFRVTKGIARYTSGFTPPSAPFPNS